MVSHLGLAPLFGVIVGFSLGLSGGGGSLFAVPLLVYGLGLPPHEAIGLSLTAVGATALFGAVGRLRRHEVDLSAGLLFAVTGMLGAPVGTLVGRAIPEPLLLSLFAGLMVVVGIRFWVSNPEAPAESTRSPRGLTPPPLAVGENVRLDRRRFVILSVVGGVTGILAGTFGVGGGFLIVPGLVMFGGMAVHRAVATSLLVIALVSGSGVLSFVVEGRPMHWSLMTVFVLGGMLGMLGGTAACRRVSAITLHRIFSVALVALAGLILVQTL